MIIILIFIIKTKINSDNCVINLSQTTDPEGNKFFFPQTALIVNLIVNSIHLTKI